MAKQRKDIFKYVFHIPPFSVPPSLRPIVYHALMSSISYTIFLMESARLGKN
jgi:hypothetical protein